MERLEKYYDDAEITEVKALLKYMVQAHLDDGQEDIDADALFDVYKEATHKSGEDKNPREEFRRILDILLLDNIVDRRNDRCKVSDTLELKFWYDRLVGKCPL